MSTFADLGLPEALRAVLTRQGILEPFPIQAATLPDALAGHDVCGRAPTGSGKTLAFGLPILAGLQAADTWAKPGRPLAVILLPTRELAAQVATVLTPLAAAVGAKLTSVYGGVGYGAQRAALRKGVDLLVGCPGRMEDLISQGDLDLTDVRWAVLDEADRMCDMGFLPAVRRLLDRVGPDRQMLLYSATLDGDVDVIVNRYLDRPRRHEVVGSDEETGDVVHQWWKTTRDDRTGLTAAIARAHGPAVVFTRTRHGADRVARRLNALGITAVTVHGSRSQPQRDRALAAFTAGQAEALVATDVAARGIHVDGVGVVVHFDPPTDAKDYTHRSGRTGRAGADGLVITFVTSEVLADVKTLQRGLGLPPTASAPALAVPVAPFGPLPGAPRMPVAQGRSEHGAARAGGRRSGPARRSSGHGRDTRPGAGSGDAPARDGRGHTPRSQPAQDRRPAPPSAVGRRNRHRGQSDPGRTTGR